MGGSQQSSGTTQTQNVQELPPWINQAAQQNYALAQSVSQRPLEQYQGQLVADVGPQTQQAWNLAAQGGNAGQPQYNAAQAGYQGVLGQSPMNVQAGQLANTNLSPYMNPYTQQVINKTLPLMQQQLGIQQNQLAGNAAQNNAFGGSRFGVAQGVAGAQGALNMGQMAEQLNQANFGQAQAAATGDINRRLAAAQGNQQAQQAQQQANIAAAGGLGGLGQQAQLSQIRNFQELAGAGAQEQQQAQNQINAQIGKFNQAWQYPASQLGAVQSALGMTPFGTANQGQQTTQTQQTQSNPFGLVAGGLDTLGGLFGAGGAFPGVGTKLLGAFGAAKGTARVPHRAPRGPLAASDTVPAMLTPGEAVLNRPAAALLGRDNINRLNQRGNMAQGYQAGTPFVMPPSLLPGVNRTMMGPRIPGGIRSVPMPQGMPPGLMGPVPGPLSGPGVAGGIGALGAALRRPPRLGFKKPRAPRIRGALGG